MKRLIILCLLLGMLSGCSVKPNEYPFEHQNEPIESVDLLYYPWIVDDRKPFMEFQLIRTLAVEEISEFMDKLCSLETKRVPRKVCLLFSRILCTAHDHVDDITCGNAQCIHDEVVNVRCPVGKRQLEYLYTQRYEESGSYNLEEIIQALIKHRQYYSCRDKHKNIAENVIDHVCPAIVIQQIHERDQVDPAVEDLIQIQTKR